MSNRLDQPKPADPTPIGLRDVDAQIWREIKAEAARQGVSLARLIEGIWAFWQEHPEEVADWLVRPAPGR